MLQKGYNLVYIRKRNEKVTLNERSLIYFKGLFGLFWTA